jgi:hypothetical protein
LGPKRKLLDFQLLPESLRQQHSLKLDLGNSCHCQLFYDFLDAGD